MKKALITGITGFAGSHLAEYLLKKDYQVFGTTRGGNTKNIKEFKDKLILVKVDINNKDGINKTISDIRPEEIYHLAAQASVPVSWNSPEDTMATNALGTIHLLEAIRKSNINPLIHVAGSSEEYGLVKEDEVPIKETNPLRPLNPYSVSKVTQDMLAYQYFKSYGLKIIITRGFNHTGPGRKEGFVCSSFAKQIAEIEKGLKKPIIHVGNMEAERDFTDVRDMVRAYHLALQKCIPGERYNICSGKVWKVRKVLDILLEISKVKAKVEQDKSRMRPSDIPILSGDNTKFVNQTDWKPNIPFEKTLNDLLEYWRKEL